MKRKGLLSLLFTAVCLAGCGGNSNSSGSQKEKLYVGLECDYAPFNWTDPEKNDYNYQISGTKTYADGYDVQIAKQIAEELDMELVIKKIEWDGLISSCEEGTIDLIIAGMSPTEERLQSIDFTVSYYESTHVMLVKKDSPYANATKLSDFTGATVIGQTGTIYADLVPQVVAAGATAGNNLATVPQIVAVILRGDVHATIVEEPVAKGICSQYSELKYIVLTDGFEVADEDKIVSIGVRKNYELTDQINEVLQNIITESVRANLMEQAINNAPTE